MSDIEKEVVDTFFEHELHTDEYDKNCSACYSEKRKYSMPDSNAGYEGFDKSGNFELAGEMSAHPSNWYW